MRVRKGLCLFLLVLAPHPSALQEQAATAEAKAATRAPALTSDLLAPWARHIRPAASELAWQEIDWMPSFVLGVLEADARQRPLLFWAMNGHPLGCT